MHFTLTVDHRFLYTSQWLTSLLIELGYYNSTDQDQTGCTWIYIRACSICSSLTSVSSQLQLCGLVCSLCFGGRLGAQYHASATHAYHLRSYTVYSHACISHINSLIICICMCVQWHKIKLIYLSFLCNDQCSVNSRQAIANGSAGSLLQAHVV